MKPKTGREPGESAGAASDALQSLGYPKATVVRCLRDTPISSTWQVDLAGTLAVLRIDRPLAARLGLDRHRESAVLGVVARAGLGPRALAADPSRGLLLTGWLPGRAWTEVDIHEPAHIEHAAALLRRLHSLPATQPAPGLPAMTLSPLDLPAAVERYAGLAGAGHDGLVREARDGAQVWLQGALQADPTRAGSGSASQGQCLCHNDPVAANFIATPDGLRLIDWEYAALGDPWFDLAVYAAHHRLAPEGEEALLQAYLGRGASEPERVRLHEGTRLYTSLQALWAVAVGL